MPFSIIKPEDEEIAQELPVIGVILSESECMEWCIKLAWLGAGGTKANPLVGCVAVDQNKRLIAYGCHKVYGQAHAEQNLIAQLITNRNNLQGATVFVSLEPCAHVGKTPSCAATLIEHKPAQVIYGLRDPNPLVAGKGVEILKQAGIKTNQSIEFAHMAKRQLESFFYHIQNKKPFVALKIASTLDGVYGSASSERILITGPRTHQFGHWLRQKYDAILIGPRTLLVDNPSLNVRYSFSPLVEESSPIRVVYDQNAGLLKESLGVLNKLGLFSDKKQTILALPQKSQNQNHLGVRALENLGVKVIYVQSSIDLLEQLYELGISSVLVEGGSQVWREFSAVGAQRIFLFMATKTLGSKLNHLLWHNINLNLSNRPCDLVSLGEDILYQFGPQNGNTPSH